MAAADQEPQQQALLLLYKYWIAFVSRLLQIAESPLFHLLTCTVPTACAADAAAAAIAGPNGAAGRTAVFRVIRYASRFKKCVQKRKN